MPEDIHQNHTLETEQPIPDPEENQTLEVTVEDGDDKETAPQAEVETEAETDPLEVAQQEIASLKDQNLRLMAEFDNYRKRTLREKTELILNGGEKVISALLPVLDDLERAEANMDKNQDYPTLREGFDLIVKKLRETLDKQGLKRIDTDGKTFDTDYHEAIAMVPVEDKGQAGQVIDCIEAGYMLGDKVLRHAKVAVGQ